MYYSNHDCILNAEKYINELNWWLVPIRGSGNAPKAPLVDGWPDWHPSTMALADILKKHPRAGIGIHLGGSDLIDLEGDSPDAEALLEDLCRGLDFPCWRSRRSKHRLFQANPAVGHLNIKSVAIEFRTGRHQSVLPPTVFQGGARYEWLVSPFEVLPPQLPDHLIQFYQDHAGDTAGKGGNNTASDKKKRFPYRDDLDYLLRHFDLLAEVENAGLDLVCHHADNNGNIPCYVPAVLRNGNEDRHLSGIFNIYNGVLRDFGSDQNHRYFRLMEALTGEPWLQILRRYEKAAGPISGHPHSRRISLPTDRAATGQVTLDTARAELTQYLDEQLSRPPRPKTINLIKGPCGVGKTYSLCKLLGEKRRKAVILTLENDLASKHVQIINEIGKGNASRMPVLKGSPCPHQKEYEATTKHGYKPSQTFPCRQCPISPSHCQYLLGFQDVDDADQLCCAAIYHTHEGFYDSYGNENRPVVVFDENCVDLILAPHSKPIRAWSAWGALIQRWPKNDGQRQHADHLTTLVNWMEAAAADFQQSSDKFRPYSIPDHLHDPQFTNSPSLEAWLNKAHSQERPVPNLYDDATYLLTQPEAAILLEKIGENIIIRFRRKHPLPEDKEVFILDATANEDLIRVMAPDWEIKVWDCPQIEQKGSVIQIMDYDVSRNRIRKEVDRHRTGNPSWLVQVLDRILEKVGPTTIISFKRVTDQTAPENDILGLLANKDMVSASYNYPCRGHNVDSKTLIVLGTPYKDEATLWELALALYGMKGLPASKYERRWREYGDFTAGTMSYDDPHLTPIIDFLVSADLGQAIGRVRPIQNDCTVYVISNAPIPDWEIAQVCASELFDLRQPLRKDANDNYLRYGNTVDLLVAEKEWVKNADVCQVTGIAERTGRNYWNRYKDDHKGRIDIQGPRIRRVNDDY